MNAAEYNARRRQLRTGERWWADQAREDALVAMHGGGCNKFGVFVKYEKVALARVGKTFTEARLARSPAGLWIGAGASGGPDWGASSAPSVWDMAHDTRRDAYLFVILECLAQLERHAEAHSTDRTNREARKMDRRLRELLAT